MCRHYDTVICSTMLCDCLLYFSCFVTAIDLYVAHTKGVIVEAVDEENCLAHAVVISFVNVTNDCDYTSYR